MEGKVVSLRGQLARWKAKQVEKLDDHWSMFKMRLPSGNAFFLVDWRQEGSESRKEIQFPTTFFMGESSQANCHKLFKRFTKAEGKAKKANAQAREADGLIEPEELIIEES